MPTKPPLHRPAGWRPREVQNRDQQRHYDDRRGSAASRGYNSEWQRVRDMVMRDEPLCRRCAKEGNVRIADLVHHIEPVTKRPDLRLVVSNLEPICRTHHAQHHADDGK